MSDAAGYQANLRRGQLLRESGRPGEACEFLSAALEADPDQPQAYLELALAQSDLPGLKRESLQAIDRAISLAPDSAFYLGYKAYLLSRYGLHKEALEFSHRALEIHPTTHIALLAQANAQTKLGQWVNAESTARRLLEFDADDTSALNLLAQALRFQNRLREGRQVTAQILARTPNDPFGQANAGYEALKTDDHLRAREHFLNALRIDPHYEHARFGLLQSLRERVLLYRINLKILTAFPHDQASGQGFRIVIGVLTVMTGGAFLGLLLLYLLLASTLQPISNFFLLLEPVGRHALTLKERRWAMFTGAAACVVLLALTLAGWDELVIVLSGYLSLFALCVYVPQWVDAWRAWRETRLAPDENRS